jgi:hypothetical protein
MTRHSWSLGAVASAAVILVVVGTAILTMSVETPPVPTMRTTDVFDTTLTNGLRWVVASVETNVYDSLLIARYTTMLYHRLIPQPLDDTGAVRLEVYVFDPSARRLLEPHDAAILARNNPAIIDRLMKLSVVDSAYVAVRLSAPWILLGQDTLTVFRSRIYVPRKPYRWSSLIRRQRS